jgi:hypothetical protein
MEVGINPVVRAIWGGAEEGHGDLPRIGCLIHLSLSIIVTLLN